MCGPTLTLPRIGLLAAYLAILFGLDWLEVGNKPLFFLLLGLAMSATILSWRRTCAPSEGA